jgi:hypothetical protein
VSLPVTDVTHSKVAFSYLSANQMSSGLVLHAVLLTDLFNRQISGYFNPHPASPPLNLFLAQQHFLTVSLTAVKQHTIEGNSHADSPVQNKVTYKQEQYFLSKPCPCFVFMSNIYHSLKVIL